MKIIKNYTFISAILFIALIGFNSQIRSQEVETSYDISWKTDKLPDGIVAIYQEQKVTEQEWRDLLTITPLQEKGNPMHPENIDWKHLLIQRYVFSKLAAQKGLEDKLDRTEEFIKWYESINLILLSDYVQQKKIIDKSIPTEEEMIAYYEENREQFASPEYFKIRHIFVDISRPGMSEEDKELAYQRITEAYTRLKSGESFEDVAKQYSEVPDERRGQITGPFTRGAILEEIENAALALQQGQFSSIVTTRHGYNIIFLEEHQLAHIGPFSERRDQVREAIQNQRIPGLESDLMNKINSKITTKLNFDLLDNPAADENDILIEINGFKYKLVDLNRAAATLPTAPTHEQKLHYLNDLTQRAQYMIYARKIGLDQDKDIVDRLTDIKENYLAQIWTANQIEERIAITDDEIRNFYEQNTAFFIQRREVLARNIYIKANLQDGQTRSQRNAAMREAQIRTEQILAQLNAGSDFIELAKKYSMTPNAANGGYIGWVARGPLGRRFDMAVENLKEGELSGLVEMTDGYQIIKIEGIREPRQLTFEEAKEQTYEFLKGEKSVIIQNQLFHEILKKAELQYDITRL